MTEVRVARIYYHPHEIRDILESYLFITSLERYIQTTFNSELFKYMLKNNIKKSELIKDENFYNKVASEILENRTPNVRIPGDDSKESNNNKTHYS